MALVYATKCWISTGHELSLKHVRQKSNQKEGCNYQKKLDMKLMHVYCRVGKDHDFFTFIKIVYIPITLLSYGCNLI